MKPKNLVNLYIVNADTNSDLRDMPDTERYIVEERRLTMSRDLLPAPNIFTDVLINGERRNAIAVQNLTHREAAEAWYRVGVTFGDFNPDRQMFEKVEIEV